jgi:hypothetical protein
VAYPIVSDKISSIQSSSTSHLVALPAGIQVGDLLIVFFGVANNPSITWPGGWTALANGTTSDDIGETRYRVANGSEGSGITLTTDTAQTSSHYSWRITNYQGVPEGAAATGGLTSTIDPPNLAPSWGNKPCLWIAHALARTGTYSGYPTGYSDNQNANESTVPDIARASKFATASSDDPGVFTVSGSIRWVGITIAVRGADEPIGPVGFVGVGSLAGTLSVDYGLGAALQGVATLDAEVTYVAGLQVLLQGIARVTAEIFGTPFHDFTIYDAYIDAAGNSYGLLFYDKQEPETVALELQPTRSDVGNNPEEIRPEYGNFFAQSDFSHGAGQHYYHQPGRDPKRFFYSEGFDISEPGKLSHLRALAEAYDSTSVGRGLAQVGGLPFVAIGNRIRRGDGAFPGTWTEENPHVAEGDQTVQDLTAEGARLFAALGTNGVHIRSSAGTWSHFQPDGATNLNTGTPTRVAWLKERLIVVGGTSSRSIYEVAASSTPTAMETLPEGWTFEDIFEAGGFIHACAVNVNAGMSRIHHYGLNSGLTALEKKSSTALPKDQLAYSGAGYLGFAYIGVGRMNSSGGYDPILYRATINDNGALDYAEIREETGAGSADLGVRSIATAGETILVGWSLGSGAFGGARDGIAVYNIARDAFAYHLRKTGAGAAQRVLDIMPFKGRVLISLAGDGLYYEDLVTYVATAQLVTSLADWNNAGRKVWDTVEISHDPLPAATAVKVEYGLQSQELASWTEVFTSSVDGAEGDNGRISNVKSRLFALRITGTASASATPGFLGYSVRSLPSPATPEWALTRYIRLLAKDRKDEDGQLIYQDPRAVLLALQDALHSFVTFYEAGFSWTAWLTDVSAVEPAQPLYEETKGEARKDVFVVRLKMIGTR